MINHRKFSHEKCFLTNIEYMLSDNIVHFFLHAHGKFSQIINLIVQTRPAILDLKSLPRTWRIPMQTSMEVNDLSWTKVRVILKRLLFIILLNLLGFLEFNRTLKSWLCFQEFKSGSLLWKFIFRKEFL